MSEYLKQTSKGINLAIHGTDQSFGFASRKNNNVESDTFFIKKFDKDLCNNLIYDFYKFISKENLRNVNKISVTIGPANFNASRLIVVLARTISQQMKCPLESFSCFKLISQRIAQENNIYLNNKSFWIYKKLKRKGFIAGKYEVCVADSCNEILTIREKIVPKIRQELDNKEPNFQATFQDEKDLKELLNLSNNNSEIANINSWEKVLPLYPISATS
tara:strand:+ start:236 stop:889 length:654 start_codon:yes stop_codon:yes gene_type:complete